MYITIFNVFWIDRANVTESSTLHKTRLIPDQAIVKSEVGCLENWFIFRVKALRSVEYGLAAIGPVIMTPV